MIAWAGIYKGISDISLYSPELEALCKRLDVLAPCEGTILYTEYLQAKKAKQMKGSGITNEFIDKGDYVAIKVYKPARGSFPSSTKFIKVDREDAQELKELVEDFNAIIYFRRYSEGRYTAFIKYNATEFSLGKILLGDTQYMFKNGDTLDLRKENIAFNRRSGDKDGKVARDKGKNQAQAEAEALTPFNDDDEEEGDTHGGDTFGDTDGDTEDFIGYDMAEVEEVHSEFFEKIDGVN